jgi:hypothetical protein
MAIMTFTYTPSYHQEDAEAMYLEAEVEYKLEIPETVSMTVDDVHYHVDNWLRSLGYVISE